MRVKGGVLLNISDCDSVLLIIYYQIPLHFRGGPLRSFLYTEFIVSLIWKPLIIPINDLMKPPWPEELFYALKYILQSQNAIFFKSLPL